MDNRTLDLQLTDMRENLAVQIAGQWQQWKSDRRAWELEKNEIRDYVFATDTRKTSNAQLPWKNSTTIPKLCQIRDNLHANYMAALFPNDNWLSWEAGNAESDLREKKKAILAYMRNKTRTSQFRQTVSQLVYDFIDYGNPIADVDYVRETVVGDDGEEMQSYIGPRLRRISIMDMVFNPTAASFDKAPKIVRTLVSYGTLTRMAETLTDPDLRDAFGKAVQKSRHLRQHVANMSATEAGKIRAFSVDGFGSLSSYLQSSYVELLEFEGDLYDANSDTMYSNYQIFVIDRSFVLLKRRNPSWLGQSSKKHCGWRLRPDNLYAMGPLDNLVGMQYRIDHLENLKADIFDMIAHPQKKVRGMVEGVENNQPGATFWVGDDGDIEYMHPDVTALNADFQIQILEQKMEEMAGAPKQAMGIRTPGEKTAYEVQKLENAAGRIFQSKITYFEEQFLEPLLNAMLAEARRNLDTADLIRVVEDDLGVAEFIKISKDDLTAQGVLRPIGARHFAAKAQLIQNLTSLYSSSIGQDPSVMVHLSGKKIAKLIEEQLNLEQYGLFEDNVRVIEQADTAKLTQAAQDEIMNDSMTDTSMIPEEGLE